MNYFQRLLVIWVMRRIDAMGEDASRIFSVFNAFTLGMARLMFNRAWHDAAVSPVSNKEFEYFNFVMLAMSSGHYRAQIEEKWNADQQFADWFDDLNISYIELLDENRSDIRIMCEMFCSHLDMDVDALEKLCRVPLHDLQGAADELAPRIQTAITFLFTRGADNIKSSEMITH